MGQKSRIRFALLVILAVVLSTSVLIGRDDPPPSEEGLRPISDTVADSENGYLDHLELKGALIMTQAESELVMRDFAVGRPSAAVEAVIARNAKALRRFGLLASRPYFQDPTSRDLKSFAFDTPVPMLRDVAFTARLSSLKAAVLLEHGRATAALEECLNILAAGRQMATARQPLIVHLVGLMLIEIGAARAVEVAGKGRLSRVQLIGLARRLASVGETSEGLRNGLRFEYVSMSNTIARLPREWKEVFAANGWHSRLASLPAALPSDSFFFRPNRTRRLFAERFRILIEEAGKPCLRAKVPPQEPARQSFLAANGLGRAVFDDSAHYYKLYPRRCAGDLRVAAGAVKVALKAYRLDKGGDPASLAALVPTYLPRVPADPFDGKPLAYSGGSIHSPGKDSEGIPVSP